MNEQKIIAEIDGIPTTELFTLKTSDTSKLSDMLESVAEIASSRKRETGELPLITFTDAKETVITDNAWNLMTAIADKYNTLSKNECYLELSQDEKPLAALCRRLDWNAVSVKEKSENGEFLEFAVNSSMRHIDVAGFMKFCNGRNVKIGEVEGWYYKIEWLNCLLTAKGMGELSERQIDELPTFNMSKAAKAIKFDKNAVSNTKLLETVREIVSDMIGEEFKSSIRSHDVRFLVDCHSKKSRKNLTVEFSKNKALCRIFVEICHRVLEGIPAYCGDSREVKKQK